MKKTAKANSNIALVKYWGKRNEQIILPTNSNISMTLSGFNTTTTVEFSSDYKQDQVELNEQNLSEGRELEQIVKHLDLIRRQAGMEEKAKVVSKNNFPTAAGLASSASGFAALSLAASKAAGLNLDKKELSILARQGSGSASRSVEGGFVEWLKGSKEDGSDSFGNQIAPPEHWPEFRMITTIVATEEKKIKSRAGMKQTMKTSPYYKGWLDTVEEDFNVVRKGILDKNFSVVGKTAQKNALKMHATMQTTLPPIIYWNPATMRILHSVIEWHESGMDCFFTIDAGPNVKVLCLEKDVEELKKRIEALDGVKEAIVCEPGEEAKTIEKHLF